MTTFLKPDPGKPHMEIPAIQVLKITVITYDHTECGRRTF